MAPNNNPNKQAFTFASLATHSSTNSCHVLRVCQMPGLGQTLGALSQLLPTCGTSCLESGSACPHLFGLKQMVFLPQDVLSHLDMPPFRGHRGCLLSGARQSMLSLAWSPASLLLSRGLLLHGQGGWHPGDSPSPSGEVVRLSQPGKGLGTVKMRGLVLSPGTTLSWKPHLQPFQVLRLSSGICSPGGAGREGRGYATV